MKFDTIANLRGIEKLRRRVYMFYDRHIEKHGCDYRCAVANSLLAATVELGSAEGAARGVAERNWRDSLRE